MRSSGRTEYGAPRWGDDSRDPDWGLQGEALILELQRLRRALEAEKPGHRRRRSAEPHPPRRRPPQKHSRKTLMGQAIDVCLQHIGLKSPAGSERPAQAPRDPNIAPPNRPSPALAPRDPLTMDLSAVAPEMAAPAASELNLAAPDLAPTHQGEAVTRFGTLIETCRHHAMTSAAFLLGNDTTGPPPDIGLAFRTRWALDNELRTGLRVLVIASVLGGGWFFFMPLAGAVVVPGNLVVQSNVKTVQHPTGGVVADIRVANGMRVKAGDLLVRLDATQARASLQVLSKQLDELRARSRGLPPSATAGRGSNSPANLRRVQATRPYGRCCPRKTPCSRRARQRGKASASCSKAGSHN